MLNLVLTSEGGFYTDNQVKLGALIHDNNRLIANIHFSTVVWVPMQNCSLDYSIDAKQQDRGLMMSEFLPPCLKFIFQTIDLHRIQASYLIWSITNAVVKY